MLQLPLLYSVLALAASLPPGRICKEQALDRVAQHACLTTLPQDELADNLDACIDNFEAEVIWDEEGNCDRYGVLETKLVFCQAAVARWMSAEHNAEPREAFALLLKAHARCSGAALCHPDRPKAHLKEAASPRRSPQSAHSS